MRKPNRLHENYEESLFALLMRELAQLAGDSFASENEQLLQDPAAELPPEAESRTLAVIDREAQRRRRELTGRRVLRGLSRVGIAALVAVMLFTVAFASSETFRVNTLNLTLRLGEITGDWRGRSDYSLSAPAGDYPPNEIWYFQCRWVPEGFQITSQTEELNGEDQSDRFEDEEGHSFTVDIAHMPENGGFSYIFDTENTDRLENVEIQGATGVLIEKRGFIYIHWPLMDGRYIGMIYSDTVDAETLLQIAESVVIDEQ